MSREYSSKNHEVVFINHGDDRGVERKNKLKRLMDYLGTLREHKFTGYIKINYSQGNIGRVERFEEVLKE